MEVLKAMEADAGTSIKQLRVDGGATVNNLLLQIQADVLHTEVIRPKITETTAIGAAYLAGLAVGFWKNIEEIEKQWATDRIFKPSEKNNSETLITGWYKAIEMCKAGA
jgi:glycerol kinase